ncbi:MAG TPA: CDP-alcohol phosphatidyltransferase family protein [Acidimicrobiales bacterium]|nr:CDP-alcohol phosphatidyltransferase family protein [Acidimicrobiales bacterium]
MATPTGGPTEPLEPAAPTVVAVAEGESRILTVPNAISVVRLLCIPLFLLLLFGREERVQAALLLAALGATDWVDGFIARRWDQVSELGKLLDPIADRMLLVVAVVAILIDGSVPVVVAVLTIARESVVFAIASVLALARAKPIPVSWWGKAGTFGLMFAYPLFLAGASEATWAGAATVLAWVCVVPGLVLGYLAAALYLRPARDAWRIARVGDDARGVGSSA